MDKKYQVCSYCLMDTTDPNIVFDENGRCNYCKGYDELMSRLATAAGHKEENLNTLVVQIKKDGRNKKYDCIIGVSGGVDSTYAAYIAKEMGLRPLAVHMDNGWNSELAVSNIEKVLNKLGIDLYTHVLDWEEFRDLQVAFLKASTPDSEIPTDHAIFAVLYRIANKYGVKYIISGGNYNTEAFMAPAWSYGHRDWKYIKSVNRLFGKSSLKTFPHYTMTDLIYNKLVRKQQTVLLLNYVDYDKGRAIKVLEEALGWKYYGGKHYESIYTKFFQAYILPTKFGYDKRKVHLSNLICSGQITRDEALSEIQKELYSPEQLREDRSFVIKKFGLTEDEFDKIMALPKKSFYDYPSYEKSKLFKFVERAYFKLKDMKILYKNEKG